MLISLSSDAPVLLEVLRLRGISTISLYTIVPQLDKCLKFMAFRGGGGGGVILYRVGSFSSPRIDLNFRHLSSCYTMVDRKQSDEYEF